MSEVERTELVTDELYSLDVQFISDDDKYFPFEVRAGVYGALAKIAYLAFPPWLLYILESSPHLWVSRHVLRSICISPCLSLIVAKQGSRAPKASSNAFATESSAVTLAV